MANSCYLLIHVKPGMLECFSQHFWVPLSASPVCLNLREGGSLHAFPILPAANCCGLITERPVMGAVFLIFPSSAALVDRSCNSWVSGWGFLPFSLDRYQKWYLIVGKRASCPTCPGRWLCFYPLSEAVHFSWLWEQQGFQKLKAFALSDRGVWKVGVVLFPCTTNWGALGSRASRPQFFLWAPNWGLWKRACEWP